MRMNIDKEKNITVRQHQCPNTYRQFFVDVIVWLSEENSKGGYGIVNVVTSCPSFSLANVPVYV